MFGSVPAREKQSFYEGLRVMCSSGLPLTRALGTLRDQGGSGAMRRALDDLVRQVHDGNALADSLARHPGIFSDMEVHLVRAGETGGTLDDSLRAVTEFLERREALKSQITLSLIYPAIVVHGLVLLPPLYILFTETLGAYLAVVLPLLALLYGTIAALWALNAVAGSSPGLAGVLDRIKLRIPLLGTTYRKAAVARAFRALGALYRSGVPVLQALELAARSAGNSEIRDRLLATLDRVRNGSVVSEAVRDTGLLSPMLTSLLVTGDESGQMDACLHKVAQALEEDVAFSLGTLTKVLPIVILLVLAVFVLVMVVRQFTNYIGLLGGGAGS